MGIVLAGPIACHRSTPHLPPLSLHAGYGSDVHTPAFRPFGGDEEHFNSCEGGWLVAAWACARQAAAG